MKQANILVVDDEENIREAIKDSLSDLGFRVLQAADGNEALNIITKFTPDLILLDIIMPGMSGYQLLRRIPKILDIPVIILSARTDIVDKVEAFELGADDYIPKPFLIEELRARVQAVLRRKTKEPQLTKPDFDDGHLKIVLAKGRVYLENHDIELTKKEFGVLQELVNRAGTIVLYQNLLHIIWGDEYQNEKELVQAVVKRLRLKIEPDPRKPKYILTVDNIGYRFKDI